MYGTTRGDQHGLADALAAVARHVTRDLAAAHREADDRHIVRRGVFDDVGEIIGEAIVVVAVPRLRRAPEAAPVVGNRAHAGIGNRDRQIVERVGRQRPAVHQDHRTPGAPVFQVEIDVIARGDVRHADGDAITSPPAVALTCGPAMGRRLSRCYNA
jgi:hypothetical protein